VEMRGLMRDGRRKFRVVTACGSNRHHKCMGKVGSALESLEIRWSFNVAIARSAALVRWRWGGHQLKGHVPEAKMLL